jgi:hypothetical protein
VTIHSVTLSNLTASTLYHFRVGSTNSSGGTTLSSDSTFTTATAIINPPSGALNFLTGYALNGPSLRNGFSGFVGMRFTVGSSALSVSALGRIFITGNSGTHTVKLVQAATGTDVPGGSVSVSMVGGVAGRFKYVSLGALSRCRPAHYYLVTQEPTEAINGTTPVRSPPPLQGSEQFDLFLQQRELEPHTSTLPTYRQTFSTRRRLNPNLTIVKGHSGNFAGDTGRPTALR